MYRKSPIIEQISASAYISSVQSRTAYLTMVRPQIEYASDVWDPHKIGDIVDVICVSRVYVYHVIYHVPVTKKMSAK